MFWGPLSGKYLLKCLSQTLWRMTEEVCLQPLGSSDVRQQSPFWHACSQVLPEIKIRKPSKGVEIVNIIAKQSQIELAIQSNVQGGWQQRWPHSPFKLERKLYRVFWPIVGQVWGHREWGKKGKEDGLHLASVLTSSLTLKTFSRPPRDVRAPFSLWWTLYH